MNNSEKTILNQQENWFRNKIILISFVCSILVIYIHANNLATYGISDCSEGIGYAAYVIETFGSRVTSIAVPCFFVISGFLFFRSYKLNETVKKYKRRCKTILVPYVFWCSFYYLLYVFCTNISGISNLINNGECVEISFINWVKYLTVNSYYVLWFLKNLIVFIIASPMIYIILKDWHNVFRSGLILLVTFAMLYEFVNKDSVEILKGLNYYAVGSYIGINFKEIVFYKNKVVSKGSLIVGMFLMLTGLVDYSIITILSFIFCMWFALDLFKEIKTSWWMQITFFTYASHDFILEALEKLWLIVFGKNPIFAIADYILMPIIVEIILIIIAYYLNKYFPQLWIVVSGDRHFCIERKE